MKTTLTLLSILFALAFTGCSTASSQGNADDSPSGEADLRQQERMDQNANVFQGEFNGNN
jgi:outer membrane biogenesis lipoprotein LolB